MTEQQDGFLGRWSRLKQDQTRESATAAPLAEAETATPLVEPQSAEAVEVIELTDADMPDVDSLGEDSDFTGFWSEQVSEGLRRKALQKLFHLPEFNIRDGLNEYDDDYTQFAPLGDTVTYQMKQFIERQKAEFQQALADDPVAEEGAAEPAADREAAVQIKEQSTARSTASTDALDDEDELGCCD